MHIVWLWWIVWLYTGYHYNRLQHALSFEKQIFKITFFILCYIHLFLILYRIASMSLSAIGGNLIWRQYATLLTEVYIDPGISINFLSNQRFNKCCHFYPYYKSGLYKIFFYKCKQRNVAKLHELSNLLSKYSYQYWWYNCSYFNYNNSGCRPI